jgi:CRP-like cAMP-binding protein
LPGRFGAFFDYPTESGSVDEFVFLSDRDEDDWARLISHTETRRFDPGDVIMDAGEVDRALYVVVRGRLEVLVSDDLGEPRHQLTIGERTVVGEMGFLDGQARTATVRAVVESELLRLTFDSFEVLSARYPELGRAILLDLARILAVRLRQTNEALAQLSH